MSHTLRKQQEKFVDCADNCRNRKWTELLPEEVDRWNQCLARTDAHYRQYPYWNEPYRSEGLKVHYLIWGAEAPEIYACVVEVRFGPWKLGILQRGPVRLVESAVFSRECQAALSAWAKAQRLICIRLTCSDARITACLDADATLAGRDSWPFNRDSGRSLLVNQLPGDDATLSSFQPVARSDIKKAEKAGYDIQWTDTVESLSRAWMMFEELAKRKGFLLSHRPKHSWMQLCEIAQTHGLGRLYSASIGGRCVEAVYVIRYGTVAEYMLGAIDLDALGGDRRGPSCLLHWRAMRDFFSLGCTQYNLGGAGDMQTYPVWQFKRKFRPTVLEAPEPRTMIVSPLGYTGFYRLGLQPRLRISSLRRRGASKIARLLARQAVPPAAGVVAGPACIDDVARQVADDVARQVATDETASALRK